MITQRDNREMARGSARVRDPRGVNELEVLGFGAPRERTPVEFDPDAGCLRIGPHARPIGDATQRDEVYAAYLSLLYAVRGAAPGQRLPLRSADLEALLLLVGDDPQTIEQRLVALMGCTPAQARALRGVLLRHRRLSATLGVAAVLGVGGLLSDDLVGRDAPASPPTAAQAEAPPAPERALTVFGPAVPLLPEADVEVEDVEPQPSTTQPSVSSPSRVDAPAAPRAVRIAVAAPPRRPVPAAPGPRAEPQQPDSDIGEPAVIGPGAGSPETDQGQAGTPISGVTPVDAHPGVELPARPDTPRVFPPERPVVDAVPVPEPVPVPVPVVEPDPVVVPDEPPPGDESARDDDGGRGRADAPGKPDGAGKVDGVGKPDAPGKPDGVGRPDGVGTPEGNPPAPATA
jgi:hypothetical protein